MAQVGEPDRSLVAAARGAQYVRRAVQRQHLIQRRLKGDQVGADEPLARRIELLTRQAETRTHRRVGVVTRALGVGHRGQEQIQRQFHAGGITTLSDRCRH